MMAGSEHTDNALHWQLSTDPHSSVERQRGGVVAAGGGGEETEIKAFVLVQFVRRRKRNSPFSPHPFTHSSFAGVFFFF